MAQDNESLYLEHLRFDKRLANSFIARYISNVRLILLIVMSLVVAGVFSFMSLPRELNPEVDIALVNVITTLPGASPRDVEELVTKKIEKEVINLGDVDMITSQSNNSVSVISIQFLGSVKSDEVLPLVKEKVDLARPNLPEDASEPRVEKLDFNDQPVLQFVLTGQADTLSLSQMGLELKEKLENQSGVRSVSLSGQDEQEIVVLLQPQALQESGLSLDNISQALRSNDVSMPAGVVKVNDLEYSVAFDNEFQSVEDIRALPISIGEESLLLGEVAQVFWQSKEQSQLAYVYKDGVRSPAVQVNVYKASNAEIVDVADRAKKVSQEYIQQYSGVHIEEVLNFSTDIERSFTELQDNFMNSVILVFGALTLFLGMRQAMIAAISLPLTLLCTFIVMNIFGISLNFLSIFSLLLAMGLIGDDAIVIVHSSKQYQQKFSPFEAGLLVFRDFFIPIWTGTLTVVWSFVPLLLAGGIIGKFIRPIPIVVSATLLSSTLIATMINLPLNVMLAKLTIPKRVQTLLSFIIFATTLAFVWSVVKYSSVGLAVVGAWIFLLLVLFWQRTWLSQLTKNFVTWMHRSHSIFARAINWISHEEFLTRPIISLDPIVTRFKRSLLWVLPVKRRRYSIYAAVISLIVLSVIFLATGLLKSEFFPKVDQEYLFAQVEGPAGWNKEKTDAIVFKTEQLANDYPEITHIISQVGQGSANRASLTLRLKPADEREKSSSEIAEELREKVKQFSEAKVTVVEESGGPPAGSDFQANIYGDDLAELEKISNDFQTILSEIPGAVNIDTSLKSSPGQISVDLKPTELAKRNLNVGQVGGWLRTALSGSEVGSVVWLNEDRDITVALDQSAQNLSTLQNLTLPTQFGSYALGEVADLQLENSPSVIERQDGKRVVRVTAGVTGTTAPALLAAFQEKAKDYDLPAGYSWDVGGVNEENTESTNSILQAMNLSLVLILVTMVLLLSSFRKAFIVLAIIPVAMAGVFFNFTLFGIPLSFPALIGVLALFGIVVNNSIMLMDKINQNLNQGFPFYEAIADACASRIEPIFLSSFTGILGLLPVTISDPLWRGLGGAIVAGLSVGGIIIVYLLPSMFVDMFGKDYLKKTE